MRFEDYPNKITVAANQNVEEKKYWLDKLSGEFVRSSFPCDHKKRTDEYHKESLQFTITGKLFSILIDLSKGSDNLLHVILTSGITVLLGKYTGNTDIIVGTPVYKQETEGDFVNTVTALRNPVEENLTFKELLMQMRRTLVKAIENQNYPIEMLPQQLGMESFTGGFPLFDVAILIKNIHDKKYLRHIKLNMIFSFLRTDGYVEAEVEYNSLLYDKATIERISGHLIQLLWEALSNLDLKLSAINILSQQERRLILFDFNDTGSEYPRDKTIQQLFEEQAERIPDNIAVISRAHSITYRELNEKSHQLARILRQKGITPNTIVGIMVRRSPEMVVGVFGILRSGGAYLPIDPGYPAERKKYILADSNTQWVLTQNQFKDTSEDKYEVIDLEDADLYRDRSENENLEKFVNKSRDLAYVIYTSGSTGKPKGVMIEHRSMVNRLNWMQRFYPLGEEDVILQKTPYVFDVSVWELFWWSFQRASVCLLRHGGEKSPGAIIESIEKNKVTTMHFVPSMLNVFLEYLEESVDMDINRLAGLRQVFSSGEALTAHQVVRFNELINKNNETKLINLYGPTEATVDVSYFNCSTGEKSDNISIPIGKPIDNIHLYVVNKEMGLQPIGIAGELCISGEGLARGYLNRVALTVDKFVENRFASGERLYKTGDLARWLSDGNIEFLGRIDHQLKIRGFRIELGEIESQLLRYHKVKEVVVSAGTDKAGDKYLCAYIVPNAGDAFEGLSSISSELRKYLFQLLPDYMIPSYFVEIEKIPLTPNGKVDRKTLPAPEVKADEGHIAPRDAVEEKLAALWSEVLGVEKGVIGIDSNFFQLGGHSLKATILAARIHKELNVKLSLAEIFKTLTIRELSGYIKDLAEDKYASIEPVEKKDYYALSSAQKRLYILQQMELKSTAYNMPEVIPLPGEPDIEKLEETFKKLIHRHESLRTSFQMVDDQPLQRIHDHVEFKVEYYELSREASRQKGRRPPPTISTIKDRIRPFDLSKASLLRVDLIKSGGEDHLLLVDMHHIISDGISHVSLVRDFQSLYRGETPSLLRIQYKDFSQWQNNEKGKWTLKQQEAYWIKEFEGEIPVLDIPTDYPRPTIQRFEGDTINFDISEISIQVLKTIASQEGCTLYMVALAVFNVLLAKLSRQEDIVVGTPIAGRRHPDLENIIGMFVNTLPLRNYPQGETSFNEFLRKLKERTLEAFENQEYQFEDLVDRVVVNRDAGRNPVFDVMFSWRHIDKTVEPTEDAPVEEIIESQSDQYLYKPTTSKFDITLTVTEIGEKLPFTFTYNVALFKKETLEKFAVYFRNIVSAAAANMAAPVSHLEIITAEEKRQLLYDFNNTDAAYPGTKTIHRLFEEQSVRTPDHIAEVGLMPGCIAPGDHGAITYHQLNKKSDQLAALLRSKGIDSASIVAIMIDPSLEMMTGILGVLKSGSCYLPLDPQNPAERIRYILKDSETQLLLTQPALAKPVGIDIETWNINNHSYKNEPGLPGEISGANHPVYMIYTSGTTGKPKGVMLKHKNLVNYVHWFSTVVQLTVEDKSVLTSSFAFDLGYTTIYPPLLAGAQLHLLPKETYMLAESLLDYIRLQGISYLKMTSSLFSPLVSSNLFTRETCRSLRWVVLGGEEINVADVEKAHDICRHLKIMNHYGPTEVTIGCIAQIIDFDQFDAYKMRPTIGRPIFNTRAYILDKYANLLPVGIAGELGLSGVGVAKHYFKREVLTKERFIPNPFTEGVPNSRHYDRIYRTGDLARRLNHGNIEFLGRIDHQIKIRGFRIELGEIENQLLTHEGIKETVVMMKEDERGDRYLCAYIVSNMEFTEPRLIKFLSARLPYYMVPSYFVFLETIPLTPNGKINRKALPEPELKSETVKYTAPTTDIEEKLVEIWSEILTLEKEKISTDVNFFQLGGHSLKAIVMISKIHKEFNVRVPLAEVFKNSSIKGISQYIKELAEDKFTWVEAAEKKEYYILSSAQKRLYILNQVEPESTAYNMPSVIPLAGEADVEKLEETFIQLIQRHESLRTSFLMIEEESVQKIHNESEFSIRLFEAEDESEVENVTNHFIRPFDLSRAPLLRAGLLTVQKGRYILLTDMHHIISDGISRVLLVTEFLALYREQWLPELRIQYKDFSEWQNSEKQREKIKKQKAHWLKLFEGDISVLNLPTDYVRPALQSFEGSLLDCEMPAELTSVLASLALEEGATLYMVLLALTNILFFKLSGQEDIFIGSPVAGRRHADLEKIIGMFVNTLALRNYPEGEKTFRQFLREVKEQTLQAFENQEYPFEDLVEKVDVTRDASRNPIFDVMFSWQNTVGDSRDMAAEPETENPPHPENDPTVKPGMYQYENRTAKFDLAITAAKLDEKLFITFQYCTQIFKKETIQRFIAYFNKILAIVSKEPDIRLYQVEIIPEEERARILKEFNNTARQYPYDKTLQQLFEEQVSRTPERIAIIFRDKQLTYEELNRKSNQRARYLRGRGVKAEDIIGVLADRSLEMIVCILSILKSGGAYLCIDSQYPLDRIRHVLSDSNTRILLTQNHSFLPADFGYGGEVVPVTGDAGDDAEEIWPSDHSNLEWVNTPKDIAYIIYTSGSTGTPRGVMIRHFSVINLAFCQKQMFDITSEDCVLQFSPISFDASVEQIFITLFGGAKLVLIDRETLLDGKRFETFVFNRWITHIHAVPSFLRTMDIDRQNSCKLKRVVSGGDTCPLPLAEKWLNRCDFYNEYGPTETTVTSIQLMVKNSVSSAVKVPIGKPLDNTNVYILDGWKKLVPYGVGGELYIGGHGLARGYLNNQEITKDKFLPNPFAAGENFYRTGDRCCWLLDGNIEFLGRMDHQVKIRGYRIESGEIENLLLKHPEIKEAVVLAGEDETGDRYLSAYVTPNVPYPGPALDNRPAISLKLKEYLSQLLPDYMIPSYFVLLEKIPLTHNGKIDRKALPASKPEAGEEYTAPGNWLEIKLVEIWSKVLGIEMGIISVDANFFELGGHSLKATILISRIHLALNVKLTLGDVFKAPSIRELAGCIKATNQERYASIEPVEKKEYYELSSAQKRLYILQQMELGSTAYNMPEFSPLEVEPDIAKIEETFKKLIERHENFRTSFYMVKDHPVQKVHDEAEFELEYYDASPGEAEDISKNFVRAFDLSQFPLLRVGLVKLPHTPPALHGHPSREGREDKYLLLVDMHHIISDGVSHEILVKDFMTLYDREALPPLRVQYKDFSQWQNSERGQEKIKNQEEYWLKDFEGEIPLLNLPTDYPRPHLQSFEGNVINFIIGEEETKKMKECASEEGVTLYMLLLSIYTVLLSKVTGGQEDIVVGTGVAGRRHADLQKMIGMFVNTLAMRNYPKREKIFKEFLKEVKNRTLEAFENQDYQFEDLVEKVVQTRDWSRNPLVEAVLVFQNLEEESGEIPEVEISEIKQNPVNRKNRISKFDITLYCAEVGRRLTFAIEYSTALFKKETIEMFVGYFKEIVSVVIENREIRLKDIKISSELAAITPGIIEEDQGGFGF